MTLQNTQAADVSITCPRCHMTSHHPDDVTHGYCGACHAFTGLDTEEARPWTGEQ